MTATLAQVLQEKLGSTGAAEMLTWFDETQRDARQELRDLNELNFSRFDARVGERMAVLEQRLELRFGERMAALEQRLSERMTALEQRLSERMTALEQKIELVRIQGEKNLEVGLARLEQRIAAGEARLLHWMIGLWIVTLSAIGLLKIVG
ncbi:MAG: hypothetical protein ACHQQ3_10935 [Gemmatimonadales bacterium]